MNRVYDGEMEWRAFAALGGVGKIVKKYYESRRRNEINIVELLLMCSCSTDEFSQHFFTDSSVLAPRNVIFSKKRIYYIVNRNFFAGFLKVTKC